MRGADAAFAAARRIWDSAATPQARAYRERLGLAGDGGMAVVVMPLIEARVSGIAFTRDPVGGRHDEMLIHANWGLGEALVSGQAEGDEYRLREDATTLSWRLAASRIGAKRQASRPLADGQGTGLRPTRDDEARAATLTPAQAEALGAIAGTRPARWTTRRKATTWNGPGTANVSGSCRRAPSPPRRAMPMTGCAASLVLVARQHARGAAPCGVGAGMGGAARRACAC